MGYFIFFSYLVFDLRFFITQNRLKTGTMIQQSAGNTLSRNSPSRHSTRRSASIADYAPPLASPSTHMSIADSFYTEDWDLDDFDIDDDSINLPLPSKGLPPPPRNAQGYLVCLANKVTIV